MRLEFNMTKIYWALMPNFHAVYKWNMIVIGNKLKDGTEKKMQQHANLKTPALEKMQTPFQ